MAWINILQAFTDASNVPKYGLVDANRHVVVQVGDALPAGANTIGSVNAIQTGSWNIVNISGTISLPTGAATETTLGTRLADSTFTTRINTQGQKAMAASTPVVIASDQSAVSISGTVTANQGGTWNITNISGTVSLPTGAATSANQSTIITALQLIDNIPHAANVAFSNGVPAMGQFDDSATGSVTEDNVAAIRITSSRGMHINLRNASGTELGVAGAPLRVDPTGTTTQPVSIAATVTVDTELPTAGALADGASATPTTPTIGAVGLVMNATTADRQRAVVNGLNSTGTGIAAAGLVGQFDDVSPGSITENQFGPVRMSTRREAYAQIRDAAGNERGLNVDANGEIGIGAIRTSITPGTSAAHLGKAEDAVHASGDTGVMALGVANEANSNFGADGDYTPLGVDREGSTRVIGNRAHDAVDSGNPIKIGGKGVTTEPSAVSASGDRVDAYFDDKGYQHNKTRPVEDTGTTPSNINTTYNNTTTTATSADITKITGARTLLITLTLAKANTPQDLEFFIDGKDGSNYFAMKTGLLAKWIYDDTYVGSGKDIQVEVPAPAQSTFRMRAVAQGTDATNTFTVSNCKIFQRT